MHGTISIERQELIATQLLAQSIAGSILCNRTLDTIVQHNVAMYGSSGHAIADDDSIRLAIQTLHHTTIVDNATAATALAIMQQGLIDRAENGQTTDTLVREIVAIYGGKGEKMFSDDELRAFMRTILPKSVASRAA